MIFEAWPRPRYRQKATAAGLPMDEALSRLKALGMTFATQTCTLRELIDRFLADKKAKGRRAKTLEHYARMLNAFAEDQPTRPVRDIQPIDVLNWVQARYQNPESQATVLTPLLGMFRWAASTHRRLVDANWIQRLPKSERTLGNRKLPRVFIPEDVATILKHATPSILPTLAPGAFAGIRPEELTSGLADKDVLNWQSVDFATCEITIPAEVSKTRQEATLRGLPDNLWAWLEAVPTDLRTGPSVAATTGTSALPARPPCAPPPL